MQNQKFPLLCQQSFGRKKTMAAEETLQGSLFTGPEDSEIKQKSAISKQTNNDDYLSDDELASDSKARPRSRKNLDSYTKSALDDSKESISAISNDLPPWSHHSQVNIDELTPVLKHYVELKIKNPDRVLLYRLGDFFECFFEDAIKLSQLLELTLTGKEGGKAIGRVPMAGVPHHAVERYCGELVQRGISIALCDQLETTPSKGGALLKRGITRIITPGTIIEEGMLEARKNNWLGAILIEKNTNNQLINWGLATADVSTGEFFVRQGKGSNSLYQELMKSETSELIWGDQNTSDSNSWCPSNLHLTKVEITPFSFIEAEASLKKHYNLSTTHGIGLKEFSIGFKSSRWTNQLFTRNKTF